MIYLLDFREKRRGGAVVPGSLTLAADGTTGARAWDALLLEPRVGFLVHGFNVDRPTGRQRLLDLAARLPAAQPGGLVAVLWPGDHWTRFLSYSFEGRDADDTAGELARFIADGVRPGTPLSFVSHSLGARVVLETLRRLPPGYPARQICLMAASIDDHALASPRAYALALSGAERLAVLSSRSDKVLRLAYPAGDLLESFAFAGETPGCALGYRGPRGFGGAPVPGNVFHRPIPKTRNADHGDYLPAPTPNDRHESAARFADDVLAGRPDPEYV